MTCISPEELRLIAVYNTNWKPRVTSTCVHNDLIPFPKFFYCRTPFYKGHWQQRSASGLVHVQPINTITMFNQVAISPQYLVCSLLVWNGSKLNKRILTFVSLPSQYGKSYTNNLNFMDYTCQGSMLLGHVLTIDLLVTIYEHNLTLTVSMQYPLLSTFENS